MDVKRLLLTTEEVAEYLRVNKYTVYRFVSEKQLPAIKLGRKLRFDQSDVEEWLTQRKRTGSER